MPTSPRHILKATITNKKGRVLSIGFNSYEKSSPIQAKYSRMAGQPEKIFLHAEISAICKIRHGIPFKIKIERYDREGNARLAAPCPICQIAIRDAGIKFVEYTVG